MNQMITEAKELAQEYLKNAYAPYSNFKVAAIVIGENAYYAGVNIENASYGLTNCAERNALFNAIGAGEKPGSLKQLVIYTDTDTITTPCGACRQVMQELMSVDGEIYMFCRNDSKKMTIRELLPSDFNKEKLK